MWDARGTLQRAGWIAAAVAFVAVAALILFAVPLREAIARARSDVAHNRLVLETARARVAENAALARATAPAARDDPRAAIGRALAREGLAYVPADTRASDGPIAIVIGDARFDALMRALDALEREDGVRVVDATITVRVDPGTVRAELTLAR
jgi:type II secretory pathway component PulM